MGFSLPAAIAAKLYAPDQEVLCFVGDGGLAMVQSELRLAASLGLGIKVLVFVDGSLNRIELKQAVRQIHASASPTDAQDAVSSACIDALYQYVASVYVYATISQYNLMYSIPRYSVAP